MKSVLISTLNYNCSELTDHLVYQLKKSKLVNNDNLLVIDNGSTKAQPKSTTHHIEENIYYGGGLNLIFDYYLDNNFDYLIVFNNDLIFHGDNFLNSILKEVIDNNIDLYSPSIINAQTYQCKWKQMWNHYTNSIRDVKWIDFQCPIFSRRLVEKIKQFPNELYLGWGNDIYSAYIANSNNMKIAVSDNITICHLDGQTFKNNPEISLSQFCKDAETNMNNYFNNNIPNLLNEYQSYGINYQPK